jgi:hypothetical protein
MPGSVLFEVRPLTPVSPVDFPDGEAGSTFRPMPLLLPPRERRRFPRHRTPSATKEPFAGPSNSPGVATRLALSPPFHLWLPIFAGLLPRAESPWAPPAATGEAYLNLTTLADFCNHTEGRAHRANVRTSREAPFLGLQVPGAPKGPGGVSGGVDPAPEGAGPTGRSRSSQRARGGSRGQLNLLRAPRCHRPTFFRDWNSRERTGRSRPLLGPTARTALALEEAGGTFHTQEARLECHSIRTVIRSPPEGRSQNEHAFFTNPSYPP